MATSKNTKKYTLLRDRRPKNEKVVRELPSGAVLEFKTALDYEDGELFRVLGMVGALQQGKDVHRFPEILDRMSVDTESNRQVIADEDGWVDGDTIGIISDVSDEVFEALGTMGESKA